MFTGLIEDVGTVVAIEPTAGGQRLAIRTVLAAGIAPGDSVATNGVCLTATDISAGTWTADVSPETLRVTTLGTLRVGSRVNLERPLAADGRLGGHFVQGHVDATGMVEAVDEEGDFRRVRISFPDALAPYFIEKGAVAVDGISLTVARLHPAAFDVQIVPHTWAHTSLSDARPGTPVNLECDMIGKYVVRQLALQRGAGDAGEPT